MFDNVSERKKKNYNLDADVSELGTNVSQQQIQREALVLFFFLSGLTYMFGLWEE